MIDSGASKSLQHAAREALLPLGLKQRGRSRVWVDDRSFWLGVVEFQASNWAKGAYLNVGAMWLWHDSNYLHFDEGHRVEPHRKFESDEQFAVHAAELAERAAALIRELRARFADVQRVADHYSRLQRPLSFWRSFDAGVSLGLAGRPEEAEFHFAGVVPRGDAHAEWEVAAAARAQELMRDLNDLTCFRQRVGEILFRSRQIHKLPELGCVPWSTT